MAKLEKAIAAIKGGKKAKGKALLMEILRTDSKNERAWLWMSAVVKGTDKKEECLRRVLKLNPNNESAQRSLSSLKKMHGKAAPKLAERSPSSFSTYNENSESEALLTEEDIVDIERQKQAGIELREQEKAERQKKEEELYKLEKLIAYELSEGASGRVLIAKYIKKGFPKESVENLINELDGNLKPVKNDSSLLNLLFSTQGRVTRTTYWLYSLAYFILSLIAFFADFMMLGGLSGLQEQAVPVFFGVFTGLLMLVGIYPSFAILIKRLHDRDRSGWFLLLNFVPFLNFWVGIEVAFLPGTLGQNQYGPDPRQHNRQREESNY